MFRMKMNASKILAGFMAVLMLLNCIQFEINLNAYASTIESYTISLTDGIDIITSLNDVDVTLTNKKLGEITQTQTVTSGVATFVDFVEDGETYIISLSSKVGYEEIDPMEITILDKNDPFYSTNTDVSMVELQPTKISGSVVDDNNIPYPNAIVEIMGYVNDTTKTDDAGKYSFDVYEGKEYTIVAFPNDEKYDKETIKVTALNSELECPTLKFKIKEYEITTICDSNGSVTDTKLVEYGCNADISAIANEGYRIDKFIVDDEEKSEATNKSEFAYLIENVKEEHSVSVTFKKQTYKIEFTVGANGKVTYDNGTEKEIDVGSVDFQNEFDESTSLKPSKVLITATPNENYRVSRVVIDGDTQDFTDNDKIFICEFDMTVDHSFVVEFDINTFSIDIINGNNGSATVTQNVVPYDGSTIITINPDDGYNIESIMINDELNESYTINADGETYSLAIECIKNNISVDIKYSLIESISMDAADVSFDLRDLVYEDTLNNDVKYVFNNSANVIVKTTNEFIKINDNRAVSNEYTITETTVINMIQVYFNRKWHNVILSNSGGNIIIVIDKDSPKVIPDCKEYDWTKDDYVTITGRVEDNSLDENDCSSGLSYIVWSKDITLEKEDILNSTENKVLIDNQGTYRFNSIKGDQDAIYYLYAVDYSGNVSSVEAVKVKIDRKNPEITDFVLSVEEKSIVQDCIEFLIYGSISSRNLYLRIDAIDEGISSGLKEITLYCGQDKYETKSIDGNSAVFELTEEKFKEGAIVSAVATDIAGNDSERISPTNVSNVFKSNEIKIDGSSRPNADIVPDESNYIDEEQKIWYKNSNIAFTITAKDDNTGIKNISVKLNGTDITDDVYGNKINEGFDISCVTEKTFIISTPQNVVDGENVIEVVVINNANIKSDIYEKKFYVDTTKPDISNFDIARKENTPFEKVLHFLTFGIFFNDKVEITVTANDANASAGIDTITLYVDGVVFDTKNANDDKVTFTIPVEEITDNTMHFDKVIAARATDCVGHITDEFVEPNTENSNIKSSSLMIETIKPTVLVYFDSVSENKNLATADNKDWYKSDVKFVVEAKDLDSGIRNVYISINDTVLVNDNLYSEENHMQRYEVSTGDAGVVRADNGSYTIKVIVTDNAGNVNNTYSKTVYKDVDEPYITGFSFDAVDYIEGSETYSSVYVTDYGFYFKEDTKVTISAKDAAPSSGIKSITYYTVDKDTGKSAETTVNVNKDGGIDFIIKANFKGQIYAKVTDNVGNVTNKFVNPNSAIIEKKEKHNEETHILFAKENTSFTTNDNSELYAKNVPVKITVIDTYSGIRSVEWSVVAPNDTGNNQSGEITVNNNKTFASNSDTNWTKVEEDGNLVTKMEKTIIVNNNSNNIVLTVKMTDRAGNTSTEKVEFSIDKTNPEIAVVYDNNDSDTVYNDIYKADRVATIIITERNFRSEDIVYTITNSDGVIPAIDLRSPNVWSTIVNKENPDQTIHVARINYATDGDYTFDISYSDNADNSAAPIEQNAFTIDKTNPVLTVVYDNNDFQNGNYFKEARTASIIIKEHNFDSARVNILGETSSGNSAFPTISSWKDSGNDIHIATLVYAKDSKYTFDIEFIDKAGNSIAEFIPEEFYIDMTAPTLEIRGVTDKSANKETVAPIISYSDMNFNKKAVTITLTGINNGAVNYSGHYEDIVNGQIYTYENFEMIPEVDDIYSLSVKITDLAGNETEKNITFSANRFGSVYDLSNVKDIIGKYWQDEKDIVFTEINVDSLDREDIKIKLTKNGIPIDLVEITDYTVNVSGGDGQWSVYKYTIKKKLFEDDGTYSIAIYSVDAAGNVNENIDEVKKAEISFGIDKTKPVIVPIDLESGVQYAVDMKVVSVEIKDNLVLDGVKIYLNDIAVDYNVDGEMYTFEVPKSSNKQNVKIVAIDLAGNEELIEITDFLVNANIFVRWYNNTNLFVGSIIVGVVSAIGAATFIVFGKKKRKGAK